MQLTEEPWQGTLGHKVSCNIALRVYYYKHRNRWRMSPLKITKMFPGMSSVCWRCGKSRATYMVGLFKKLNLSGES